MKTLTELYENRSHASKSAQDLLDHAKKEDRVLNPDEQKRFDEYQKEVEQYDKIIVAAEEHEVRRLKAEETTARLAKARISAPAEPIDNRSGPPEDNNINIEADFPARYSKLDAFPDTVEGRKAAHKSGRWIFASFLGDESSRRWCVNHGVQTRALGENINTAGGVLVPQEFEQAIIDNRERYGVFRQNAANMPMGRDVMVIPRMSGGITPTFTAENAALTESEPTLNQVTLTAKKLGALTRISTELADDAFINVADMVANEFARGFALKEDTVGFIGDGTAAHGGITGLVKRFEDNTGFVGAVAAPSAIDEFGDVTSTHLATLMGTLPQFAVAGDNAAFYCSRTAHEMIFNRIMAAGGGNTTTTLAGKIVPSYLGHEIRVSQVLPSGATTTYNGLVMFLFGDLRLSSTLGDRRGITVRTSVDRYIELDQIAITATERMDINNHDVGDATDAGPVVAFLGTT